MNAKPHKRSAEAGPIAPPTTHVVIIDGTLSSLRPGHESHAGRIYRLLREVGGARQRIIYHPGVQGQGWRKWLCAATGEGLDAALRAVYAKLASRYQPGDKIFLFGYSRGAYAARSLGGWIDRIGLLRRQAAAERRIIRSFRYYEAERVTHAMRMFRENFCHPNVDIEMIGVFDTVKALGLPYPGLSWISPMATEFHDHRLGPHIKAGYQALAIDEDRLAFRPVYWETEPNWRGRLEQRWFPGAHADVGGQIGDRPDVAPLAALPLIWMLARAEAHGLTLPNGWRSRFETDATAPMIGSRAGMGRFFLLRRARRMGVASREGLDPSIEERAERTPRYKPRPMRPSSLETLLGGWAPSFGATPTRR